MLLDQWIETIDPYNVHYNINRSARGSWRRVLTPPIRVFQACNAFYLRQVSFLGFPFAVYGNGELIAFSRILAFNEVLVIFNPHGLEERGADVVVDASLNPEGSSLLVVCNTAQAVSESYHGSHPLGSSLSVERRQSGEHIVRLRNVGPSEFIVLVN